MNISASTFIALIILTTFFSGIFSAFETALVSCNQIKFKSHTKDKKSWIYKKVNTYLDDVDEIVSRILVMNNIVNSIYATLITLYVSVHFGEKYLTIAIIISTFFLFIFGEMLPKLLSLMFKDKMLLITALLSYPFVKLIRPVAKYFYNVSLFLVKHLSRKKEETHFSEDDVKSMVKNAVNDGNLTKDAQELIERAFEFDDKRIVDIMQKWENVDKLKYNNNPDIVYINLKKQYYTRLPVIDENNNVLGIYNIKNFLQKYITEGKNLDLKSVTFPPFFLDYNEKIDNSLKILSINKVHMAFVKKFDAVCGIVTIEDILEELVGEIKDEEE